MNLYGYAAGDPVNVSDPFGLKPTWLWCLAFLVKVQAGFNYTQGDIDAAQSCDGIGEEMTEWLKKAEEIEEEIKKAIKDAVNKAKIPIVIIVGPCATNDAKACTDYLDRVLHPGAGPIKA